MAEAAASSHQDLSKLDVARIRSRLLEMRTEFEARRSDRDILQLRRVEAALEKLARGGYGACESCARPVVKARLLTMPDVRYCGVCSGGKSSSPARRGAATAA
jgi:RNA polymerase-binding transcription factor DksA